MRLAAVTFAAALATLAGLGAAHATPITGTFTIDLFQGNGGGDENSAVEQANNNNPLLSGTALAVLSYTGALNFSEGSSGTNSIGAFLASGGGSVSLISGSAAWASQMLSTAPFALTTLFEISGTQGQTLTGTVTHDDGASLYQGSNTVFNSQEPTDAIGTAYTLAPGAFTLDYIEANGLPAVLNMDVATAVPEPASLALLGAGLLGLGAVRRRRGSNTA